MAVWEDGLVRPLSESRGATERQKSGEGRMTARGTEQVRGTASQRGRDTAGQRVTGTAGQG